MDSCLPAGMSGKAKAKKARQASFLEKMAVRCGMDFAV
jgi:hypothetical protein